jgi:hypothetical protein
MRYSLLGLVQYKFHMIRDILCIYYQLYLHRILVGMLLHICHPRSRMFHLDIWYIYVRQYIPYILVGISRIFRCLYFRSIPLDILLHILLRVRRFLLGKKYNILVLRKYRFHMMGHKVHIFWFLDLARFRLGML